MLALFGITLSFLGFVAVLGTVSILLVGDGATFFVVASAVGLVASGIVAFVLLGTARRVDRYLVRVASVPTPLERIKAQYVDGRIDERGLERGLERILAMELQTKNQTRSRYGSVDCRRATLSTHSGGNELAEEAM